MPFINVYLEDRAFGGHEEGGWYYSTGELVKTIPASTARQAKRALRLVERWVEAANKGRPPVSSVLSQGRYAAHLDRAPGANWPAERPSYE